jgi:hypothetical protein
MVGFLGLTYPADQLVRAVPSEHVEQASPVEQLELLDGGGRAIGEQCRAAYPVGSVQRCGPGDRLVAALAVPATSSVAAAAMLPCSVALYSGEPGVHVDSSVAPLVVDSSGGLTCWYWWVVSHTV